MTKQEIINEIKKFEKLVERKNDENDDYYGCCGYEIYEDDNSGALFEIDYDGDEIVHAYEIEKNDCSEQLRVLF